MKRSFFLTEEEKKSIRAKYLIEEPEKEERTFCHSGNVKTLDEIMGDDEQNDYIEGIVLRNNGVRGLCDRIELLKTLRLHPNISDGGEHLAYEVMNYLKGFNPYRYFDEVKKECTPAMDKIIELYKESEHGEELVRDIEKVQSHTHLSTRAKEFLKHGLGFIK